MTAAVSDAIRAGLAKLGIKRLLFAIHDVSFPSDPDEDLGRGSPATRAAGRLFAYVRALGFTGVQLGPQGQTSRMNASPYDGTIFSRHLGNIGVASFRPGGAFGGLVAEQRSIGGLSPAGRRVTRTHTTRVMRSSRRHIARSSAVRAPTCSRDSMRFAALWPR